MKKKLVAFTMAALMAFASTTAVFAEEETEAAVTVSELNWSDFEEEVAATEELAGDFIEFEEISVKMYLPAIFEAEELTEEDKENGFIGYYSVGDTASVAVQYVDMDGMTLEEYADMIIEEYGVTELEPGVVNGNDCISYIIPEDESRGVVAFGTDNGYILAFTFCPINDEDFQAVCGIIMASIQSV